MRHLRHINRIVSVLSVQRERQEIRFKTHIHCTWNAVECMLSSFLQKPESNFFFLSHLVSCSTLSMHICVSPASRSILFIWPEDFGVGWRRTNKTLLFVFSQCFTSLTWLLMIEMIGFAFGGVNSVFMNVLLVFGSTESFFDDTLSDHCGQNSREFPRAYSTSRD